MERVGGEGGAEKEFFTFQKVIYGSAYFMVMESVTSSFLEAAAKDSNS